MRRALNLNARRELWIFFIFGYWYACDGSKKTKTRGCAKRAPSLLTRAPTRFLTFSFLRLVVSLSATQHCGKDPALDADPSDASYSTDFSKQAYASALRQYTTCQNGYIAVRILFILVNLACLAYAGHRRVQMRRRYGLPGNDVRDYALWIAFPWCALAQESRTLSHNRVLGGVWRGPAAPFVPPPVQAMSHEAPRAPAPQPAPPSPGEGAAPTRAGALREHAAAAEEAPPPAAAGGYVPPNLDFE